MQLKRYRLTFIALLFLLPVTALSKNLQGLHIGIKGGFNYTIPVYSMSNLSQKPEINYNPKYQIGLSNEFRLYEKISILAELFYEKRVVHVSKIIPNAGPSMEPYAFKLNYSLISLPILLKTRTNWFNRLYFLTGFRFEKIIKAKEDYATVGTFFRYEDVSKRMPNLTCGIDLGIGNEILFSNFILMPEIRYVLEMRSSAPEEYSYPEITDIFTNHSVFFNIGITYPFSSHYKNQEK